MNPSIRIAAFSLAALLLAACGGGGGGNPQTTQLPAAVTPALGFEQVKTLRFSWSDVAGATHYRLLEDPDGSSGFQPVSGDIASGQQQYDHVVPLHQRVNARYIVQSCNSGGCTDSDTLFVDAGLTQAIGYFKGIASGGNDYFGRSVAISADGGTLAVGRTGSPGSPGTPGEIHLFQRQASGWGIQARLKAGNEDPGDWFGWSVALSADGKTLAVGAVGEDSSSTGIDSTPNENAVASGAVYVYRLPDGAQWYQQAYIKASNTDAWDRFGSAVALSADGNILAVGAPEEKSGGVGIGADPDDNSSPEAGAAYVFAHADGGWTELAYVKPDGGLFNPRGRFGDAVALSADGRTLAVGAPYRDYLGNPENGVVFIFERGAPYNFYLQQDVLAASNTGAEDRFGSTVALSADGDTLAVGAPREDSSGNGGNDAEDAGAVYIFTREDGQWSQQAYVKAANAEAGDRFGYGLALSADGNLLAVGAGGEDSGETGLAAGGGDNLRLDSGAAYVFAREVELWVEKRYVKASNTDTGDSFGRAVALSADGGTLAVGAAGEDSAAGGLNGDQTDNSVTGAGAVYLY